MPVQSEHVFHIPDKERDKCTKKLKEVCELKSKHIDKIEEGIYAYTKEYCSLDRKYKDMCMSIYKDMVSDIVFNFKNSSTMKEISTNIADGKFNAYNIAFLTPEEKDKECWKKIKSRIKINDKKLKTLPTIKSNPCKACGKIKFFFEQRQTRSADEPVTNFFTCVNCGKVRRVNK